MIKKLFSLLLFFLVLISISFSVFAAVEVFSDYQTNIKINPDNTMDISKKIKLQNVHSVGVVPGQVEFKILTMDNSFEVLNYSVKNRYGEDINSKLIKTQDYSVILLSIFQPILPGFTYDINIDYKVSYEPSGFFFKKFQIPLKENIQIPIKKGFVKVVLPKNTYFTYLDYQGNITKKGNQVVIWKINPQTPDSTFFEYSYLPIRVGNFQGSIVFWSLINLILIIFLIREIRRNIKLRED